MLRDVLRFLFLLSLAFFPAACSPSNELRVWRIIDGDSLVLNDGREVRLLGIDCPEFKDQERNVETAREFGLDPDLYASYAPKASDFLYRLTQGQPLRTEIDPVNARVYHHDEHARFLAYVYLVQPEGEDLHINEAMVHQGYCLAYRKKSFRYRELFFELERDAQDQQRGIWGGR